MKSDKHTPGPWEQGGLASKDEHWMRDIRDMDGNTIAFCGSFPAEVAHANARLIAAAPEMLEALRLLTRRALIDGGVNDPEYLAGKAAIIKAT